MPLVLGCAQLGNLGAPMDDATAASILQAAWDAGIRRFDTAPHYGLGLSERRLGRFLASKEREEFWISTKVGRLLVPVAGEEHPLDDEGFHVPRTHRRRWAFDAGGIRASLNSSLNRLGLDRVDAAYLHDPEDHLKQASGEGYRALVELRAARIVGEIGVGNKNVALLTRMVKELDIDRIMLAGRYTLLDRSAAEELLPACREHGVAVDNAAVFNSGILARSPVPDDAHFEYGRASAEIIERARGLERRVRSAGSVLPATALAFASAPDVVASVVVGADSPAQVRELVAWADVAPPDALLASL